VNSEPSSEGEIQCSVQPAAGRNNGVSENLDVVRSIYAAWGRGDYSSAQWADPGIEFVHGDGPAPHSWRGSQGLAEGTRAWIDVWEGMSVQAEEYRDLDDGRVLVLTRYGGRAKTSGLELGEISTAGASLFYLRDGKVTRILQYFDRARALADFGLGTDGGD
jgi:ketosteroid isomerase-like protein